MLKVKVIYLDNISFSPKIFSFFRTQKSPLGNISYFPPEQVLPSIASALQEYYRTVTLFAINDTICPEYNAATISLLVPASQ